MHTHVYTYTYKPEYIDIINSQITRQVMKISAQVMLKNLQMSKEITNQNVEKNKGENNVLEILKKVIVKNIPVAD